MKPFVGYIIIPCGVRIPMGIAPGGSAIADAPAAGGAAATPGGGGKSDGPNGAFNASALRVVGGGGSCCASGTYGLAAAATAGGTMTVEPAGTRCVLSGGSADTGTPPTVTRAAACAEPGRV